MRGSGASLLLQNVAFVTIFFVWVDAEELVWQKRPVNAVICKVRDIRWVGFRNTV